MRYEDAHSQKSGTDYFWFIVSWFVGILGILVFVVSIVVGLLSLRGSALEYAWKVVLGAFVLSFPVFIELLRRQLNYSNLTFEYAAGGYVGGFIASAILFFGSLVSRSYFDWAPTANQAAWFVIGIAFLFALMAAANEYLSARNREVLR